MYENEMREEYWREKASDIAEKLNVDNREGSVFFDMQEGHILRTTKFYGDLSNVYKMISPDTCEGEILDEYARMDGLSRLPATSSKWNANFDGALPKDGSIFLCEEYYLKWVIINKSSNEGYLVSELPGTITNTLIPGTILIPMDNIDNLISASLGTAITYGSDEESDEDLRKRWKEEKSNPTGNSNRQSYKTWCEGFPGVSLARIIPLWGGANTVCAILIDANGLGVSSEIVSQVQNYVDPIEDGYEVIINDKKYIFGDGVGEGVANLGAHFIAMAALPFNIVVSATVTLTDGYSVGEAQDEAKELLENYFSELSLSATYKSSKSLDAVVKMSNIAALLSSLDSIDDYDYESLKINGTKSNITIDSLSVPAVEEVVFDVKQK